MKTRIISGIVAAVLVAGLLLLNSFFPITAVIAVAVLAAIAVYEMLKGTGAVKSNAAVMVAVIYAAAIPFSYNNLFINHTVLSLAFVLVLVVMAVFEHKKFSVPELAFTTVMPMIIDFAFVCLSHLINYTDKLGIFYFILLFNFACVTDIGAYFIGCSIGKHKLAPEISPKKTIEGAIGGAVCSAFGTLIICLVSQAVLQISINILLLVLVTPVFSVIGMIGDLFASVIKRHFGIKDYGNIMPGHGGVLDRTDSILLIAPAFMLFLTYFSVV